MNRLSAVVATVSLFGVGALTGYWAHPDPTTQAVRTDDAHLFQVLDGVRAELARIEASVEVAARRTTVVSSAGTLPDRAQALTDEATGTQAKGDVGPSDAREDERDCFVGIARRKPHPDASAILALRSSASDLIRADDSRMLVNNRLIGGISYVEALREFGSPTSKSQGAGNIRQDSWVWDIPGSREKFVIEFVGGFGMSGYFANQ